MHITKDVTGRQARFILFKLVLSYVTQHFNQSNWLDMLRFTLNARKLMVIETAVNSKASYSILAETNGLGFF